MPLSSGDRLGLYEIDRLLGKGGMGEVYCARDVRLGREVAIKILSADVAEDPEQLARFEREAKLLATLNTPTIATIHGLDESNGVRYLVMELVAGPGLNDRLRGGSLPLFEALAFARQIAEALEAVHGKGIIHRDLKPSNVKLTPEGQLKLLDFGLAKSLPQATTTTGEGPTQVTAAGFILGTPAYMSPEQAYGKPLDARSDIWSFGCLLYEMLTGRPPFQGESITACLVKIVSHDPDWSALPPQTPARVRDLLRWCLARDLDKRLGDIRVARGEIEAALRETTHSDPLPPVPPGPRTDPMTPAVPTVTYKTAPPPATGGSTVTVALLVFLAVVLAGAAYFLYERTQTATNDNTIAVLPFTAPAGDVELARLADDLTVGIDAALTQLPNVKTTPRDVVARVASKDVAQRLTVRTMLVGKVARDKKTARINVDLIEVKSGDVLWHDSLDIEMGGHDLTGTVIEMVTVNVKRKLDEGRK